MTDSGKKYYGKYRGVVENNIDPENRGRIQVTIADVTQFSPSTWAEACVPLGGGPSPMGIFVVPSVGANVWIEFERGDLRHPIWTGCMWGSQTDVPSLALAGIPGDANIVLQTMGQNSITLTDLPGVGGIMLQSVSGAMILINETGITITNGQGATILMAGNTIVMNEGALTVM
jgi:uncharacterized protein involved in type VI secretion and phage assembly